MRSTKIGIAMLNDERPHVWKENNPENMAVVQAWARLIRKLLKNVDGTVPEVVVGSEIITSVRKGQEVGEELRRAGCRILVMCYNVWNFPFLVWPFLNSVGRDVPVLSLSNNNGKFPGNVGLLATDGAIRQAGIRTHRIIGDMDDRKTQKEVKEWLRAALALTTMRNEVFGLYGGHSMGMETGFFHLVPALKSLGTTTYQIDQLWLVKAMEKIDDKEVHKGRQWFEKLLGKRLRYDGRVLSRKTLETQVRLYIAMSRVNLENGFDFCGLKGQRELTEHVCLGDVPEMLMNDPYDWNGPKEPTVCATEADAYAAVTMQAMKYISGGLPTLFMDVRLYHPKLDLWDLCNSGNHASWYATRSFDPKKNFQKITFHPALEFYFKAGGASVEFDAAPGNLTFARLGLWDDKPFMVIVPGKAVGLPAEKRRKLNAQTDPTWPHVHARLECSFPEFKDTFPCNHIMAVDGDHLRSLVIFSELAGIEPVVLGKAAAKIPTPIWKRVN